MNPDTERKLSPEQYRKILDSIQLIEIYLSYASIKSQRERFTGSMKVDSSLDVKAYTVHADNIEIEIKCRLTAYKERKREYALQMDVGYVMVVQSEEAFNDDFFEIYSKLNVPVNIWPYFREFAGSITQRMNLPPLTLPFYKT